MMDFPVRTHEPFADGFYCPACGHEGTLKLKETVTRRSAVSPLIYYIGHAGTCDFCGQFVQIYKIVSDHFSRVGNVFLKLSSE